MSGPANVFRPPADGLAEPGAVDSPAHGDHLGRAALRGLYRPTFHPVGLLDACLSIGTWLSILSTSYGVVLLAGGLPRYMSLGQGTKVVLLLVLTLLAAPRYGVVGVAVMVSLSEIGAIAVNAFGCRAFGVVSLRCDLGTTLFGAALVGIYLLLHAGVKRLLGAPWAALAVVTLVCAGCVFGLAKKVKIL